MLHLQMSCLMS